MENPQPEPRPAQELEPIRKESRIEAVIVAIEKLVFQEPTIYIKDKKKIRGQYFWDIESEGKIEAKEKDSEETGKLVDKDFIFMGAKS